MNYVFYDRNWSVCSDGNEIAALRAQRMARRSTIQSGIDASQPQRTSS